MLKDLGWLKRVKLLDTSDTLINPATNEKLNELKTLLQAIDGHVDGLEITAENVNLNTDELEAKVQSVRDQLDVLLSTRASETTLIQVRDYIDTIETKLQSLLDGVAKIKIWNGINVANIDSYGRLSVNHEVSVPGGATEVEIIESGNVSITHDNVYIIPNGETLIIRKFTGGAEIDTVAGSVIELYYDPNGTGIGMILIETLYTSGNSFWQSLTKQYIGDGTKAIRLRRRRLSGGAKEIFARWEGYY